MYKEIVDTEVSVSDKFNPNFPSEVTQEEFMTHIRRIEAGNFTPLEEHNKRFDAWMKERLANRLK